MKKRRKISIVLDANWFISACINRKSRRTIYYKILKNRHLQVYYSDELFVEFEDVINREKFRKIITPHQTKRFIQLCLLLLQKVEIQHFPKIVRDSDDDYLLGICETCQADFLITGDKDLLELGVYKETTILSMGQFLNLLETMGL